MRKVSVPMRSTLGTASSHVFETSPGLPSAGPAGPAGAPAPRCATFPIPPAPFPPGLPAVARAALAAQRRAGPAGPGGGVVAPRKGRGGPAAQPGRRGAVSARPISPGAGHRGVRSGGWWPLALPVRLSPPSRALSCASRGAGAPQPEAAVLASALAGRCWWGRRADRVASLRRCAGVGAAGGAAAVALGGAC